MKLPKRHHLQNLLPLLSVLATVACFAAVQAEAYTVSPLVIDRTLKARDGDEVTISIKNPDISPVQLFPTVNAISLGENGTISEFISPAVADPKTTVTTWLLISRAAIEIPPGGSYDAKLSIKMPPTAEPGQYHAFIGFPKGGNRPEAEQKLSSGAVPGTVVTIEVEKDTTSMLRLAKFFIDRFVTNTSDKSAHVTLSNNGTEPLAPHGEIIFYDTRGNEVGASTFNEEGASLKPGDEGSFEVTLPDGLGFGKHKAYLDVAYGAQSARLQDTTFFYIIPLKTLIGIFFGLLTFSLFLAWRVHKKYGRLGDSYETVGFVPFTVRSAQSEAKDHDIDLKKPRI